MRIKFGFATALLTFMFFCSTVNAHLMCQSTRSNQNGGEFLHLNSSPLTFIC